MRNGRKNGTVRCAIYTRKSTEEGLDQEFNSLDAQRESAEAYIKSMQHEGWECLPTQYSDGGFSGGTMERPALKRLLDDIKDGKVDCVVVYKGVRLSRALLDFSRLIGTFEEHNVSFVSVTQQFNTGTSMGRLVLNMLTSFAQFEREMISERTRDKMAAARRKGKYVGGMPPLGYDIDRTRRRLVINEDEAPQVRQIFSLYLEHQSLLATVAELDRRGWTTKRWVTKKGDERGGKQFNKTNLHTLLTNACYAGKIRYENEVYDGEHEAIVEPETFDRVQKLLQKNYRTGGANVRNRFGALLKGLLSCKPCGCAMAHTHTTRNGNGSTKRRYRYYVCVNAQKRGWANCPSKSVPAGEIEQFVVNQIRSIGTDENLICQTLEATQQQVKDQLAALEEEQRVIERELRRANDDIRKLVSAAGVAGTAEPMTARLADLQEQVARAETRLREIGQEEDELRGQIVGEETLRIALEQFDPVWETLSPKEQARVIELLVERVVYDGEAGMVAVTFRPAGIKTFVEEHNE